MTQHIDALGDAILGLTARMNANEYELLVMIREFDERGGWLSWSSQSCADWLHWRCDMSPTTARERVRIAHALKRLPETSKVFSTGRLSYSKVRALTRVATAATETSLIEFALGTSAARVEERCHAQRNGDTASIADARRHRRSRRLETFAHDGMMTISVRVPVEDGELISHALDQAIEQSGPECGDTWTAQRADALVAIAKSYMSGGEESTSSCADHYQVVVHVDAAVLAGEEEGKSDLPVESVKRLTCDGSVIGMVDGDGGEPLSVGRKAAHRVHGDPPGAVGAGQGLLLSGLYVAERVMWPVRRKPLFSLS